MLLPLYLPLSTRPSRSEGKRGLWGLTGQRSHCSHTRSAREEDAQPIGSLLWRLTERRQHGPGRLLAPGGEEGPCAGCGRRCGRGAEREEGRTERPGPERGGGRGDQSQARRGRSQEGSELRGRPSRRPGHPSPLYRPRCPRHPEALLLLVPGAESRAGPTGDAPSRVPWSTPAGVCAGGTRATVTRASTAGPHALGALWGQLASARGLWGSLKI